MSDETSQIDVLEQMIGKLKDLHNSYVSLVEKLARLQAEAAQVGLNSIAEQLGKPFSSASNNAKMLEGVLHDTEIERNKLKAQSK